MMPMLPMGFHVSIIACSVRSDGSHWPVRVQACAGMGVYMVVCHGAWLCVRGCVRGCARVGLSWLQCATCVLTDVLVMCTHTHTHTRARARAPTHTCCPQPVN